MPSKKSSPWLKYLIVAAILIALYFANVELQTYLGEKALEESGLAYHSLDEALAKAQNEGKQVLADLSAIWCPTCRSLDKQLFSQDAVQEAINRKYVFARIEFESPEGQQFQERYETRSFPTLLVLDASGKKVRELPVTTQADAFISAL